MLACLNSQGSGCCPASAVMSCLAALYSQTTTLLSAPQEILFLRHKVFREYAKIAVGSDFIHTLPSFLILVAVAILLWRNPPSFNNLAQALTSTTVYKALQVMVSWVLTTTTLWLWLILQRLLYCCVWMYWSYESEYQDVSYQWWQRVWSSYYPLRLQPPVMSASFISWIISMSIAGFTLSCALSPNQLWFPIVEILAGLRDALVTVKCYANSYLKRILMYLLQQNGPQVHVAATKATIPADENEASSICDECRSEISSDVHNLSRREVRPISYGTNWTPKPSFSDYKEPQRKVSTKSMHTVAVVNNMEDPDKLSPRHLRHIRGCHTVVPNNSSDKSSGC